MHALIGVDTNEIVAYILTMDKMRDNTAFRMLTDTAFNKGHVFDTIYVESAYEAKKLEELCKVGLHVGRQV